MSDASITERLDALRFFQTPDHECNYLAEQEASTVFVDPSASLNGIVYVLRVIYRSFAEILHYEELNLAGNIFYSFFES